MYEDDYAEALDALPGDSETAVFYGERAEISADGSRYRKVVATEVTEAALDGDKVPDNGLVMEYDEDTMVDSYPRLEEHL